MGPRLKYVRTNDDVIIIFPEYIPHRDFFRFRPKSAGFICIAPKLISVPDQIGRHDNELSLEISCYGESESLKLKSLPEEDSKIA